MQQAQILPWLHSYYIDYVHMLTNTVKKVKNSTTVKKAHIMRENISIWIILKCNQQHSLSNLAIAIHTYYKFYIEIEYPPPHPPLFMLGSLGLTGDITLPQNNQDLEGSLFGARSIFEVYGAPKHTITKPVYIQASKGNFEIISWKGYPNHG